ncbi:MAG: SpaH/EbpB family LPXTG-anchored major pilin [Clostridium sp.]|nr:SpaH/EbpB family LPXTG-anchored major pilin [Clostridium sp.]
MKIKNNIKRILSIVVSIMVMASLFTVTSFAVEPTTSDGIIDTTKTGSLKIVKYEGNDNTKPLSGVTFTYKKIADIEQIINDKTNTIVYSVDSDFKTTIGLGTADYTIDTKGYYKAETIKNALKSTSYETMKSYVTTNGGINMDATDDNGESTAEGLTLGLYVVVETDYPSNVEQPSNSFLVSLPSTVGTVGGNGEGDNLAESSTATSTKWIYDIVARPKNTTTTGELNIYKDIVIEGADTDDVTDDKLESFADYNIGDKVTFKIIADVSKDITKLKTYKIVDTLSDGLTYSKVKRVYGVKSDGTSVVLNEAELKEGSTTEYTSTSDYVTEADGQAVTIKFIRRGALSDYTQVCVDLEATLNESAVVGDSGNINNADLKYSKATSAENDKDTPDAPSATDELDTALETISVAKAPIVYTYAINLTKYIDEVADGNKIDGVEFELQDKDENAIKVKKEGDYYFKNNALDASNTILVTDTNGEIFVKGLDAGIYYLKETKTKEGYNLLKDKIKIEIKSEILEKMFVENPKGNFIKIEDGVTYNLLNLNEPYIPATAIELCWEEDQLIVRDGEKYLDMSKLHISNFKLSSAYFSICYLTEENGEYTTSPVPKYSKNSSGEYVSDDNGTFIEYVEGKDFCINHSGSIMPLTFNKDELIIAKDGKKYLNESSFVVDINKLIDADALRVYTYDGSPSYLTQYATIYSELLKSFNVSEATYGIENGVVKLNVVNKRGFDLPTTGGMGTWLFTIGGLILMAGAGVLFAKGRKSTEK